MNQFASMGNTSVLMTHNLKHKVGGDRDTRRQNAANSLQDSAGQIGGKNKNGKRTRPRLEKAMNRLL